MLADLAQPALEGSRIARRLGVDHRSGLPQRLDALGLDLVGLATRELFLETVARDASPIGGLEIGDDCLDQRVRSGVHFGTHQLRATSEALFQKAPEPAWLGSCDSDSRHHDALEQELPFVGRKIRFVRHARYSSTCAVVRLIEVLAASTAGTASAVDDRGL